MKYNHQFLQLIIEGKIESRWGLGRTKMSWMRNMAVVRVPRHTNSSQKLLYTLNKSRTKSSHHCDPKNTDQVWKEKKHRQNVVKIVSFSTIFSTKIFKIYATLYGDSKIKYKHVKHIFFKRPTRSVVLLLYFKIYFLYPI